MTRVACNLCGANDSRSLFCAEGRSLVRCRHCGLVYVNPWIDEHSYQGDEQAALFEAYRARREEFVRIFRDLLGRVEAQKRSGRLLDVGCGAGQLIEVARERGWDATGIEPSQAAARYATSEVGLDVICGYLTEESFPAKSFDAITINHSLEHMPDPLTTLRIARAFLKDDGRLVVGVPNFGSLMSRLMRSRWISLCPRQHRWQFAPRTLSSMLCKAGFEITGRSFQNHRYRGWKGQLAAPVCWISRRLNTCEAMLFIAAKASEESPGP